MLAFVCYDCCWSVVVCVVVLLFVCLLCVVFVVFVVVVVVCVICCCMYIWGYGEPTPHIDVGIRGKRVPLYGFGVNPTLWEYSHIVAVLPHGGSTPTLRKDSHNLGGLPQYRSTPTWWQYPHHGGKPS